MTEKRRDLLATRLFQREFGEYINFGEADLDRFYRFVDIKQTSSIRTSADDSDYKMQGSLSDVWHWHFLKGQIVVFYKIDEDTIKFLRALSHDYSVSGRRQEALVRYINRLHEGDFFPFEPDAGDGETDSKVGNIQHASKQTLTDALYVIAAEDPEICRSAIEGDEEQLFVWLQVFVEMEAMEVERFRRSALSTLTAERSLSELLTEVLQRQGVL